jgi:PAS domain S-box-containing protein
MAEKTDRLFADQVRQLTRQLIPATSASIINAFILCLVLWGNVDAYKILWWFFSVLAIFFIHFFLHQKFKKPAISVKGITRQKNYVIASLAATGIAWGAAGVFLFPTAYIAHQSFLVFVLGGMVAGSVGAFSVFKSAFLVFSIPTLFPIIFMFFNFNDKMHYAMGAMLCLFWFIMYITVVRLNRTLTNSLNLKYENVGLITDLENEINERKNTKKKLLKKNQQIEEIVQKRTSALRNSNKKLIAQIEERKQAENALHESRKKYRYLANTLPQVVFEVDAKGTLTFVNRIAFDFFGYSKDDFEKGLNIIQMIMAEDHERVMANIGRLQSGLNVNGAEYRAIRKDGSTMPIAVHASPIIHENEFMGFNGIVIDLTDQKTAEEEKNRLQVHFQRAQKMDAIGTLAGGIAHDFNNILSAIIGYTELSLDEIDKDSEIEYNLTAVLAAGERAKALVNQILAFARQSDENLQPTQVDTVAKEVLKFIRSSIPATIDIRQNITSDAPIMGNPTQIHQIMMNLCTNAAYAMQADGGVLGVDLKDTFIDRRAGKAATGLKPGNYIELMVSDTGTGISPETIGTIFDPFYTTKPVGEGSGMGLSVVHGIVESYGGKITVVSELKKGSVFTVYLPITPKRISSHPDEMETLPAGTERVLFVDDETSIAEMAGMVLERLGYQVTTRTSSVAALNFFSTKANDFDLVITDMTMPGMTGDKLAVELMKIRADIPVILCTGYSKNISDETAKKLGIKAFAYKPIVRAHLAKTVRKVLDEAKSQSQQQSNL